MGVFVCCVGVLMENGKNGVILCLIPEFIAFMSVLKGLKGAKCADYLGVFGFNTNMKMRRAGG